VIAKRAATGRVRWALAVAAALLVSACAAGKQAQTVEVTPVNDANDANAGTIALRAVALKAPSGDFYAKGSSAQLQMVLVNIGSKPDTLTSITSPAFSGWGSLPMSSASASPLALSSTSAGTLPGSAGGTQKVALPPNIRVSYGVPDATHVLQITGIKQVLWPGSAIRVTFTFQRAGSKTVVVPIQLTTPPGTQAVGGETSSPPGGGAASEPTSEEPSSSLVPTSSSP
jgi:copper(I)-binding protein